MISPFVLVVVIYFCWLRPERRSIRPGVPLSFFVIILISIAAASIDSRYPFGGYIRHQIILFPFLALSAICFLDQIVARLPTAWFRESLVIIVIAGFTVNSIHEIQRFPVIEEKLFKLEVAEFYKSIPRPKAIYVDHYSLIAFFIHHDDWKWRFLSRHQDNSWIDQYEIKKNDRMLNVCRDRLRWNVDFTDPSLYRSIAQCLSRCNVPSVAVFCIYQRSTPMSKET